jgi:hypothetical protein
VIAHVHKTQGFGNHVFANSPSFFGDTGPEDGKLTDGGVDLMGGTGLESGKSSYLGPATASGVGSAFALRRNREGGGAVSGSALVNRQNPYVIGCLHVMLQPGVGRQQERPCMANGEENCDKD